METSRVPRRERRLTAMADTSTHVDEHNDAVADPGDGVEHVAGASSAVSSCCLDEPTSADAAVKAFLARILGWEHRRSVTVERAHRSIKLATSRYAALVLCGDGDLVPLAAALHRRTLGPSAPFIVCDPRRRNARATARSPANRETGERLSRRQLEARSACVRGGCLATLRP